MLQAILSLIILAGVAITAFFFIFFTPQERWMIVYITSSKLVKLINELLQIAKPVWEKLKQTLLGVWGETVELEDLPDKERMMVTRALEQEWAQYGIGSSCGPPLDYHATISERDG